MNNKSMGCRTVTLDPGAFPATIAPYARYHFKIMGNGSAESPYVGGLIVDARELSFDKEAHAWLKGHGCVHHGRRWICQDAEQAA